MGQPPVASRLWASFWRRVRHTPWRDTLRDLYHTPLRDVLRGRLTGELDVNALVVAASLSSGARDLILHIVSQTRLWRREKLDVAQELIAHFQDGLEAGVSDEALLRNFGDASQAARLIRRAKKRSRPLVWQAMRYASWGVGAAAGVYGLSILLLSTQRPDVSVDYLDRLNAQARAVAPADRAWPGYRQMMLDGGQAMIAALRSVDSPLHGKRPDGSQGRLLRAGEPGWEAAAQFLRDHRPQLDMLRQAALKPGMGLEMRRAYQYDRDTLRALLGPDADLDAAIDASHQADQAPPGSYDRLANDSLVGMPLPPLGLMRSLFRLLSADTELAWEENDLSRVLANGRAMRGMARHTHEIHVHITQLVALAMVSSQLTQTLDLLHRDLSRWSHDQLVELAHGLEEVEAPARLDLQAERLFMLDLFQRIYSRHGYVTPQGSRFFSDGMRPMPPTQRPTGPVRSTARWAMLPLVNMMMADRDDMQAKLEELYALQDAHARRPAWERWGAHAQPRPADALIESWSARDRLRYNLIFLFFPATQASGEAADVALALRDAAAVVIALELYHREHGHRPESLGALTPRFLPAVPVDLSTGQPLRVKWQDDGSFVLYGLGKDGLDDQGLLSDVGRQRWPRPPLTGDWVLYPPVVQPMDQP